MSLVGETPRYLTCLDDQNAESDDCDYAFKLGPGEKLEKLEKTSLCIFDFLIYQEKAE